MSKEISKLQTPNSGLPSGPWALAIAHPGHELRIHGFLEKAKPFTFILTDGSEGHGLNRMDFSVRVVDRAIKRGMKKLNQLVAMKDPSLRRTFNITVPVNGQQTHLKDAWIYHYVNTLYPDFFVLFVEMMVENLIKYKVKYLVCDPSEDHHLSHEVVRMLSELAVIKAQSITGNEIKLFEYQLTHPVVAVEGALTMELDEEALDRKLDAILEYPNAVDELRPFISCDMNVVMQIGKMKDGRERLKQLLMELNADFLRKEFIYPAREMEQTDNYKKFIEPLYGKMLQREAVQ